jgi:hypothetical protein
LPLLERVPRTPQNLVRMKTFHALGSAGITFHLCSGNLPLRLCFFGDCELSSCIVLQSVYWWYTFSTQQTLNLLILSNHVGVWRCCMAGLTSLYSLSCPKLCRYNNLCYPGVQLPSITSLSKRSTATSLLSTASCSKVSSDREGLRAASDAVYIHPLFTRRY